MDQYTSEKGFGRNMLALFLVVILAGCASIAPTPAPAPNDVVQVDSVSAKKFPVDTADELQPVTELDPPKIDTFLQYGSDETYNKPVLRKYTSKGGEYSLDFVNIAIEDFATYGSPSVSSCGCPSFFVGDSVSRFPLSAFRVSSTPSNSVASVR